MKTLLCIFSLFFASNILQAQEYKYTYYLDLHLAEVSPNDAVIIGKGFMDNGNMHLDCYLKADSFLFLKINYADTSLQTYNGPYTSYSKSGKPLEYGNYKNGMLDGIKMEWDVNGNLTDSLIYLNNHLITECKYKYIDDKCYFYQVIDSLADTLYSKIIDDDTKEISEVRFKGQRGELITYKDNLVTKDSIFSREEKVPSFPGGQLAWSLFLRKNLNPNVPLNNNAKEGTYTVIVRFIVNTNGEISNIKAETKFGYGMEEEVIRLIKSSPKWIPRTQYGRKWKAFMRQPVTFSVGY
ncbi:MAG: energy transducer TonB [Bacteroidetes bacterium]|nr:energy transducer TonB [Bacteroidota bacterium]MBS1756261.1 energy transducer TonB [Bacteroidota bacterium]